MTKLFISHSSHNGFVRGLQQALGDLPQDVWIDSASPPIRFPLLDRDLA